MPSGIYGLWSIKYRFKPEYRDGRMVLSKQLKASLKVLNDTESCPPTFENYIKRGIVVEELYDASNILLDVKGWEKGKYPLLYDPISDEGNV